MADANVSVSFTASTDDFVSQVSEAKDALQSFSAPFGEINQQLVSFGNAASHAFSADRLAPYRDALSATQSLQQSFAVDSAKAAAALRQGDDEAYADAARAAQLAILQKENAFGGQSLAAKQRVDDMVVEATRRRDDQMAALTRAALQQE